MLTFGASNTGIGGLIDRPGSSAIATFDRGSPQINTKPREVLYIRLIKLILNKIYFIINLCQLPFIINKGIILINSKIFKK